MVTYDRTTQLPHGRGRSLTPAASRPTTSAMRAARRSGDGWSHQSSAGKPCGKTAPAYRRMHRPPGWPRARRRYRRRGRRAADLRGQLDHHLIADRDPHADQALRGQGQHPSAVGRHEPGTGPEAADRAADGVIGLGAPRLVWVERHRDDRTVPGPRGDDGAETLGTHDPIVAPQRRSREVSRRDQIPALIDNHRRRNDIGQYHSSRPREVLVAASENGGFPTDWLTMTCARG